MSVAASGRTIITTIHQPNSETFEKFDQLMLLADGRIIYMNDSNRAVDHFSSIGLKCPSHSNPADFFMFMMSIEAYDYDEEDKTALKRRRTIVQMDYKKKVMVASHYRSLICMKNT